MFEVPALDRNARIAKTREAIGRTEAAALLVTDMANIGYLTGFTGSAAMVLITATELHFITDGRYAVQSSEQLAAATVDASFEIGNRTEQSAVLTKLVGDQPVAIEGSSVTVAQAGALASAFGSTPVVTTGLIERIRRHKDAAEVARIRLASKIAADAFDHVLNQLTPTMTEIDVCIEIESSMRRSGASGPSFETIVAAGPRAALPHARPSSASIGELPLVIDWGAIYDGYHSDTTRTVAIGTVSADVADAWHAVLEAQQAGLARVEIGAPLVDIDRACRVSLAATGLDHYFTTGTGHGVGLQIHEDPFIGATSIGNIELGDVITIEPGVYLPGRFGVRIEDFYYVTEHGPERLSPARLTPLTS